MALTAKERAELPEFCALVYDLGSDIFQQDDYAGFFFCRSDCKRVSAGWNQRNGCVDMFGLHFHRRTVCVYFDDQLAAGWDMDDGDLFTGVESEADQIKVYAEMLAILKQTAAMMEREGATLN